jgi:hypothetical protein
VATNQLSSDRSGRRNHAGGRPRALRRLGLLLVAPLLLLPVGVGVGATVASAAAPGTFACTGSVATPGSLPGGTYSSVSVSGVCDVDSGQVVVTGNVTVTADAALVAAFAHDRTGPGTSGLTVDGNVAVGGGGTLVLGCEASAFACFDDQSAPTLDSPDTVRGSVAATDPLGVIVHDSDIGGDATQSGGGGGLDCGVPTTGIFSTFSSPVYSDYEDNTVGGNLRISGLSSCWFGGLRNHVGGSVTFTGNALADPDAMETLTNQIAGNLLCTGNAPAVHFGDSGGSPNVVGGFATGQCAFGVLQPEPPPAGPLRPVAVPSTSAPGYWLAARDGGVFSFGVPFLGSASGPGLSQPIAGLAAVPGGGSYDLADASGATYGFGPHAGDCAGLDAAPNMPVVGIAPAPGGNGCWLASADGGVFSFGSQAPFFGSAGNIRLNEPVVAIAAAPNGDGYYLAAADGGVFAYGPGARFQGSMGGSHLNQPIVGMAVDPTTGGYWLIARDGGVFSFDAPFLGSLGGVQLNQPVVGAVSAPTGDGYYLVASDGGVFCFGPGARFQGSTGGIHLNQPIVGMSLG